MRFSYPEMPDASQRDLEPKLETQTAVSEQESEAVVDDELVSYEATDVPLQQPDTSFSKVAQVISWVFVPILMPVYAIVIIFTLSTLNSVAALNKWAVGGVVFGINVIFPMLMIYLMKYLGLVHDVGLNRRHERLYPYLITIMAMVGTAFYLHMRYAPAWVSMLYIGAGVTAMINLIVNRWWKISAHAAGAAGVVAIFVALQAGGHTVYDMTPWIVGSALIAGFMGSCRVYLYRHTPLQVIAGYTVGFLSVYLCTLFV
jgi:membrane-associated phospholipid phosphatase